RKRLFFFQAEDGIRVFHVTGVQTCALPICSAYHRGPAMLPTTTGDTFTISIPRTAASRLLLGIALGVGAVAAFIAYANLPTGYPIRGVALGVGVVGSCGALTYWIWCTIQCIKATSEAGHETTHEALAGLVAQQHES